jgi:hypothetical protein
MWEGMTEVKNSAFSFVIQYNSSIPLELVVFYEGDEYEEIIKDKYTCYEKAAAARAKGNVFLLDRYQVTDNPLHNAPEGWITSQESLGFLGARPRWYYFFLMNCQPGPCLDPKGWCQGPIEASYTLLMTNGVGYMKHFSADEVGILPTGITFGTFYILLVVYVIFFIVIPLKKKRKLHQTVFMHIASLILYTVSMWFDVTDLADEGNLGRRCEGCQMIALTLRVLSDSLTLLTCILLAKGWTVVRRKISASGRVKIAIFMTTYIIASMFSVGNQFSATNAPGELFRTPTERLLSWGWYQFIVRVCAFVWFTRSAITTRNFDTFHRQRNFFLVLFCTMGAWILALPVSMLIAVNMELYYRARWIYAMEIGAAFAGHLFLSIIFRPAKRNGFFPFAFKTAAMVAKEKWNDTRATNNETKTNMDGSVTRTSLQMARRPRDAQSSITETGYGLTNTATTAGRQEGTDGSIGSGQLRRRSRGQSVSGGMAMEEPAARVRNLATSLRKKLGVVYEVADQLEEELHYLDEDEEEQGALIKGNVDETN